MTNFNFIICNNTANETPLLNRIAIDINASFDAPEKNSLYPPLSLEKIYPSSGSRYLQMILGNFTALEFSADKYSVDEIVPQLMLANCVIFVFNLHLGLNKEILKWARINSMFDIKKVIWVINQTPLNDFSEINFEGIVKKLQPLSQELGFSDTSFVPVCISTGGNIAHCSPMTFWYKGETLIEQLKINAQHNKKAVKATRIQVTQSADLLQNKATIEGRLIQGAPQVGDILKILPLGANCTIKSIKPYAVNKEMSSYSKKIIFSINESIQLTAGDILAQANSLPEMADQFEVNVLWLQDAPLIPGRQYKFNLCNQEVNATVNKIKYRINDETGEKLACQEINKNLIATVNLSLDQTIVFEPYKDNHFLGFFTLLNNKNTNFAGVGTVNHLLRRSKNIHWQEIQVTPQTRAASMHQTPKCIWMTGLSGSGKSTIANALEKSLHFSGLHTFLLDGDNIRHGLNRDLGFTEVDRAENIRRVAEVAKLMVEAGLVVIVSFISPFRSDREMARQRFQNDGFIEAFIDTPIDECERRDTKGLYAKARMGEIQNFTGINSPYEPPSAPDIHIRTLELSIEDAVLKIRQHLKL